MIIMQIKYKIFHLCWTSKLEFSFMYEKLIIIAKGCELNKIIISKNNSENVTIFHDRVKIQRLIGI